MTFDNLCPKKLNTHHINLRQAFEGIKTFTTSDSKPENNNKAFGSTRKHKWQDTGPTLTHRQHRHGIHPDGNRFFSLEEHCRISFFSEDFQWSGALTSKFERIGNSVPPGLMRAIAFNIKHYLFDGESLESYPKLMSYLDILNATWQEHLAPKPEDAPTVISTFAGCGGSSLGYSMAGFQELLAVEYDNNAVETFRLNFPNIPVYHDDISKLSVEECIKRAGLTEPGQLDVLDGSPPCQGFSLAGKRQRTDGRNQLFFEYVRLLRGLQPKAFIMENVPGMVKGKMKLIFVEILRELKDSGYLVKAWLLNAKYFYVPQSRERLIFIGVRQDFWQEKST